MLNANFPKFLAVQQNFPTTPPVDIASTLAREFMKVAAQIPRGGQVAVAVGSRGITSLLAIVEQVIALVREHGGKPFIVPAMGSHGGATAEGQTELLSEYGVTAERLQVEIRAGMEVQKLGTTDDGVEIFFSAEALKADAIMVVNRIKPHTDFTGDLGSGILKMTVVGLGKHRGAAGYHAASSRLGYERVLRSISGVSLAKAPVLAGVAIIENQRHEIAELVVLPRGEIAQGEERLFQRAKALMPRLPWDDIDFLIIDQIGKNISGAGMDPNIIGRTVHGYSSFLGGDKSIRPFIRRIFVRDVTPESHGNAIGIGFSDFTTTRLVRVMDKKATYINALTALTPNGAKIPIHFDSDREAIAHGIASLALADPKKARVIRIANTLALERLELSEGWGDQITQHPNLTPIGAPFELQFDHEGNLAPLSGSA